MNCKICSIPLLSLGAQPLTNFTCPAHEDKTHTYFLHSDTEYGDVEDFSVIDKQTGKRYIAWIQHTDKQVNLRVAIGTKIIVSKSLNTDLTIDNGITEEEFVKKIKRLMVLI